MVVAHPLYAFGEWIALDAVGITIAKKRSGAADEGASLRLHGLLSSGQLFQLIPVGPSNTLPVYTPGTNEFTVQQDSPACYYNGEYAVRGQVTLVRFDPVARIAAGRFAFTITQPGCDTLKVTDGRFDVKF